MTIGADSNCLILPRPRPRAECPILQYSSTPILQHSNTPALLAPGSWLLYFPLARMTSGC
jgi:hypothetical protein